MRLVLVNSTGPMGSSVVSAVIEHLGYSSIPVRDLGIHDYLMGEPEMNLDVIRDRYVSKFEVLSKPANVGGVSIPDRDNTEARCLLDPNTAAVQINKVASSNYSSLADLYENLQEVFAETQIYKTSTNCSGSYVELTTNFHHYDLDMLRNAYARELGQVQVVHMHREFLGWIESIASQRFSSSKKRFTFVLRWEFQRYQTYEETISNAPGLHVDFDDLFEPNTDKTILDICEFLSKKKVTVDWRNEKYDLFGNIKDFETTFHKSDSPGRYLSAVTRKLITRVIAKGAVTRLDDIIVYPFFIIDMLRYLVRRYVFRTL